MENYFKSRWQQTSVTSSFPTAFPSTASPAALDCTYRARQRATVRLFWANGFPSKRKPKR